jgi:uncharacterized membrane protein YidH (DUF202 family)
MTRTTSESRDPRLLRCLLIALAAAVGLAGYYGPWLAHRAAGLVIIGLDLAEYVKFLPQVASGQIAIQREIFYLPLFVGSLTASLLASRRYLPAWLRWALALSAAPLALAMLPPAWSPGLLILSEFRVQVLALGLCLALIPSIVVTRYLPDWLVLVTIALLALLAAVGPTWAFLQVRPAIAQVYRQPPPLGWGFYLSLLGFLAEAFLAVAEILRPQSPRRAKP